MPAINCVNRRRNCVAHDKQSAAKSNRSGSARSTYSLGATGNRRIVNGSVVGASTCRMILGLRVVAARNVMVVCCGRVVPRNIRMVMVGVVIGVAMMVSRVGGRVVDAVVGVAS